MRMFAEWIVPGSMIAKWLAGSLVRVCCVASCLVACCAPVILAQDEADEAWTAPPRGRHCATEVPKASDVIASNRKMQVSAARAKAADVLTVHVAWNVVHDGRRGRVSRQRIESQMAVLNAAYAGARVNFVLEGVVYTENKIWYRMAHGSREERAAKKRLARSPKRILNVYTCAPADGLLGWATFPWRGSATNQGVVILHSTLPGGNAAPYNEGDTLVHEVGHYLGLFHTFQDGCSGQGDSVADTPSEDIPSYGCELGRDSCPDVPGDDPVENFMDYSADSCMAEFTPGQSARIRQTIFAYRQGLVEYSNSR